MISLTLQKQCSVDWISRLYFYRAIFKPYQERKTTSGNVWKNEWALERRHNTIEHLNSRQDGQKIYKIIRCWKSVPFRMSIAFNHYWMPTNILRYKNDIYTIL